MLPRRRWIMTGCLAATGAVATVAALASPRVLATPASPPSAAPPTPAAPTPGPAREPLITRLRRLGLAQEPGPLALHFDPAHTERARALHALIAEAMAWYRETLAIEGGLTLAVLPPAAWDALGVDQPYGIPGVGGSGVPGEPPVIFMPATDDGLAANDALGLRPRVKPATIAALRAAGYDYETAARRHIDIVGLHEFGHAYTRRFGISPPNLWFDELLATYFAHAFLVARQPALAPMFGGVLQAYLDAVEPAHRSLADFERLYFRVGSGNYVWYQAHFQQRAAALHTAQGLGVLRTFRQAFALPRPVRPAPEALLAELEPMAPGFQAWAALVEGGR
jgi:hypothetical protein